ncbi:hypothetical protein OP853_002602 [Salmonella enterica]|nr:hypothetical protein [Salmonella enterica]EKJ5692265.1 hypothetical protein [Salmonella enterica]
MTQDELEILRNIVAQMNKGLEYISTGRVKVGYVCLQIATSDLNTMITMKGADNGQE